jgi:hypothetical protein
MPPSVTAVTAVTTADADERTRVRAAHAIGARCRGEAHGLGATTAQISGSGAPDGACFTSSADTRL